MCIRDSLKGVGAEDRRKVAIAAGLGVVVLALAFRTLFGGPGASPSTAAPTLGRPASFASARTAPRTAVSLDPTLYPELMAENENYIYQGTGRNIFSQNAGTAPAPAVSIPKPIASPRPEPVQTTFNSSPPPPPAIDLRFFGYVARKNGTRSAFLSHGDDVFVAREGDVVSHRYRVVHIAPSSIEIEDLPYHHTQTLQLQN